MLAPDSPAFLHAGVGFGDLAELVGTCVVGGDVIVGIVAGQVEDPKRGRSEHRQPPNLRPARLHRQRRAAFEAGWAVLIIYLANCSALLLRVLVLGPWFRQMRATTFPEVIRARFGPVTQQFYAALAMLLFLVTGAVWLFGPAIFTATAFGLPIHLTIPVLGVVVLFYSTTGGKWAVMAADFVQGLIMMSMTLPIAVLCVAHFDGIGGFLAAINSSRPAEDFRLFKAPVR